MLWADVNYRLNPVLAVVSTLEVLLVVGGNRSCATCVGKVA
jgi:putative spermidine/putrescine transport system permease protein